MLKCCFLILFIWPGKLIAQNQACNPILALTASQNNICQGTAISIHATITNQGSNSVFKWERNHKDALINNNPDYLGDNFHDGDIISCEYTCLTTCGKDTTVTCEPIIIHVLNDVTPLISVANNDTLICEGNTTVFTTESYYGNEVPSYLWTVNGIPVGTNNPTYITDSITNGSKVECTLSISTPSCPGSKSASSQLTIYVYPMIHPAIKITPSKTQICRGEVVVFTATANGGAAPNFSWELNGTPTGDIGPSFSSNLLKDGDSISCTITIDQDSRCHTTTSAPSNKVGIHVHDYLEPTVSITSSNLDVCAGTPVTFSAIVENEGDYIYYQWQVNGSNVTNNSPNFVNDNFKNGDKISCSINTSIAGCSFPGTARSNEKIVTIMEASKILFSPPAITIESGESAQLNASASGNIASFAWTPDAALTNSQTLTPTTIPLFNDTSYQLTVINSNGCLSKNEIVIKVLHKLYMPSAFTPNNDGKNDVFRIPPGASIDLQDFSVFDRWGNAIFRTSTISKGWDGTYLNKKMEPGAYVYFIKGTVNGRKTMVKGTVLLIR